NKPYRGWKLTYFEGGMHVPFAAKWPAKIPAGSAYAQPIHSLAILPPAAAAGGADLPPDRPIDGVNLLPYLAHEKDGAPHDVLFWRDGSYQSVLANGWKLQGAGGPKPGWLFPGENDPAGQSNLGDQEAAKAAGVQGAARAAQ